MKDDKIDTFDAIIIGSGQAGNPFSFTLGKEKWKVVLVEKVLGEGYL